MSGCHTRTFHAASSSAEFRRPLRRARARTGAGHRHGFIAWLLWAGIHIYFLIGFANRLLVTLQWAISFVTKRRGVRILPLAQAEMAHADAVGQTQAG